MRMSAALELCEVRKRFLVGAGNCHASADVLRGVDLAVHCGECVAIVGARGSGKSTLLLCAAGLLTPTAGELRWFGESSPALAARCVSYHASGGSFLRPDASSGAHLHLVDVGGAAAPPGLDAWIEERCSAGDAVVVTRRDDAPDGRAYARTFTLRGGRLFANRRVQARVAERARA